MSKAPSMPVFPDALIGDTTDLSMEEFGAYCMILFVTWRNNGQALQDDHTRMARVCRVSERRWANELRPVLARFFDLTGGTWRQLRLEKEWDFVAKKTACQSEKGKRSAEAKALKNNKTSSTAVDARLQPEFNPHTHTQLFTSKADALEGMAKSACGEIDGGMISVALDGESASKNRTDDKPVKSAIQRNEPASARVVAERSPEAIQRSNGDECGAIESQGAGGLSQRATKPARRASHLPEDWVIPPDWLAWAVSEGMQEGGAAREADRFRDYWIAKGGADGRKADWFATWRNWVRRVVDQNGARNERQKSNRSNGNGFLELRRNLGYDA